MWPMVRTRRIFGRPVTVAILNDGPVTFVVDSREDRS